MCYFHVVKNLISELPKAKIYEAACDEKKADVNILAHATCYEEFHAAALILLNYWDDKWSATDRVFQSLQKFFNSWLFRSTYHGWFYRYASAIGLSMSSIPTKNGLEGTNNMIQKDYTQMELLGVSRFLLLVKQYMRDRSMDPQRKEPIQVPTVPRSLNCNIRKTMESLRKEKRPSLYFQYANEYIWLISASSYKGNAEGLKKLWEELEGATRSENRRFVYTKWAQYKMLRSSFYTMKKSSCFEGYISCTCPIGIKDEVCKHSLMIMESENLIDPLPQPLEGRQKRGRKRKVGHALERT